ncbi:type II toxin-antitoxin system VapC family toxin [Occallatibacter riparius]|uniref:Type II toxin-antitoxin system VapC family toxin n=1 Tax=Occallatibacter riparius TaxID=1002689 RepID=A0A9J7BI86_9BACT|nr:type II toxin-antitoxin system VapC family toxin [Occallatibacter riparius]UWZ82652.1 type II toxin-antitoxin system VapC family toxin [Occallatibacter riparius]
MSLVLDSSVTLASVYPDEASHAVLEAFARVIAEGAWVPALWRLEVANVLEMGVRRARIDADFREAALRDLALLPIRIDSETNTHAWSETLRIAEKHRLTLYDAAYLELAIRRALPLATLDSELRGAALSEDVELLGM